MKIGDFLSFGNNNKLNNLKVLQYTINIIQIFRTFDQYCAIQTPLLIFFYYLKTLQSRGCHV